MAVTEAELAVIIGDLIGSDTYARNEAQRLYDAIPLDVKLQTLLSMVIKMGGEEELQVAVARHFADLIAFDFVKFFNDLAPSERSAFIESFFDCLRQSITVERVRDELCVAFADIARKLPKKPEWGCHSVIMTSTAWKFLQHEQAPFRVAGWSVLARFPMLIHPELLFLIPLLKSDINSKEKAVSQAATSCFLTLLAEFWEENAEQRRLMPLLGDVLLAVERFLAEGDNRLLKQLNACGSLCLGFIDNHQGRVVSMYLRYVGKLGLDKRSRILCLKLLRKLTTIDSGSLKKISRVVYYTIVHELSSSEESMKTGETVLGSDLFLALEEFYSEMRDDYDVGEFIPELVLRGSIRSFACSAAFVIAAAGGQASHDHAAISCLAWAPDEVSQELWRNRVYHYAVNILHRQGRRVDRRLAPEPIARLDARQIEALETNEDPVVRSLLYKRHMELADSEETSLHELREDLPFWEGILELELRHFVRVKLVLPLATALKALSVMFMRCPVPLEVEELRHLFSLLKTVSSFNDLGHAFATKKDFLPRAVSIKDGKRLVDRHNAVQLAMAAVNCALTLASPLKPAAILGHLDWIVSTLLKLQPEEGPGGFNDHQLAILRDVQSAWESVLLIAKKDQAVLSRIVPKALDCILLKAAAQLPIEVVKDCPEVRAAPAEDGTWSYYPMGNRRFAKVHREGLESKQRALKSLVWRSTADVRAPERQPLILDAASVILDMMVAGFRSHQHIRRALGCDGPSHQAAACLTLVFPKTRDECDGIDEYAGTPQQVAEVAKMVEPFLMEIFKLPTSNWWCNCFSAVLTKCLRHLPQQRIAALMPNILSIVSRALERFPSSPRSAVGAADVGDLDDDRELESQTGAPRTIACVIHVAVIKCTHHGQVQKLFALMAEHCEHLSGLDASLECLALGLEIIVNWVSDYPDSTLMSMDWMFSHLVDILERLSFEVRDEPQRRPRGVSDTRRLHQVYIDQLIEDTAWSLAGLAPIYEKDIDAMGTVLIKLTDIRQNERKNRGGGDRDFCVWTSFAILAIVTRAIDSRCGLSAEVLNEALGEALTDLPLPHALSTCPELYEALVNLYCDVRLPSKFAKKHVALMANFSSAKAVAWQAWKHRGYLSDELVNSLRRFCSGGENAVAVELALC